MAFSDLKLTYFDIRGFNEVARIVLAYAGKEYKDIRVARDDWPNVKLGTPIGQMPLLEMDGDVYPQSQAIWAFLAKEFGLYGKSNKDQLIIDIVMGVYKDVSACQAKWFYLEDGPEKEKKKTQSCEDTAKYLAYFEKLLTSNSNGYFVGDSVTLADIVLLDLLTGYCHHSLAYSAEKYPRIAKNLEIVNKHETIGPYLKNRPDSDV